MGSKSSAKKRGTAHVLKPATPHALLALLVNRLGLRCSDAFQLPFRLTHDRFGELIGATRVTTTRLLSKWRQAELLEMSGADLTMRFSPELIESSPLSF